MLLLGVLLFLQPAFASAVVTVAPGQSITISANLSAGRAVSGANVTFFVVNSAGKYTGLHPNTVVNFTSSQAITVSATLNVPSTLPTGTYTAMAGIYNHSWAQLRWVPNVFTFAVGSTTTQTPPTISGTPGTSVNAGSAYSFTPVAKGASGAKLTFSIANKPTWANFSATTGALTGTPSTAGTYANIIISVSDGKTSVALSAFTITVKQVVGTTNSAQLTWNPPVQNTDGSALTDLTGYKVYYGTSASSLTQVVTISSPSASAYTVTGLSSGTWYFAVTAYTSSGTESGLSGESSKTF